MFDYLDAFRAAVRSVLDLEHGQLRYVPEHMTALILFLCASVLFQGLADVVMKILSHLHLFPQIPWRVDFLFLTAISVLMGYQTFVGLRKRRFEVTRNSVEVGLLVETGLIVGDAVFLAQELAALPHMLTLRLPFLVLTTINVGILLYVYHALGLRQWVTWGRG